MDSGGFRVVEAGDDGRSSQFETLCDNGSRVESNSHIPGLKASGSDPPWLSTVPEGI
jgi:hypothetical protein